MYFFPINIIWIERGIILLILEHICDNYHSIKNKNIILENNKYRQFIQSIFKNLSFSQNSISNKDTFYFNIRKELDEIVAKSGYLIYRFLLR